MVVADLGVELGVHNNVVRAGVSSGVLVGGGACGVAVCPASEDSKAAGLAHLHEQTAGAVDGCILAATLLRLHAEGGWAAEVIHVCNAGIEVPTKQQVSPA
jgi:hypothetical protein